MALGRLGRGAVMVLRRGICQDIGESALTVIGISNIDMHRIFLELRTGVWIDRSLAT